MGTAKPTTEEYIGEYTLTERLNMSFDTAYNMGVDHCINMVTSVITGLKMGDPKENIGYVNLLDSVNYLLVTLKKQNQTLEII